MTQDQIDRAFYSMVRSAQSKDDVIVFAQGNALSVKMLCFGLFTVRGEKSK